MDNNTISLLMMLVLFAVFYFVLIRPQRRKDKQIQEMRKSLKVGDNIVTIGGIYGRVVRIKDDILVVQSGSDRTKLEFARWAVSSVEDSAKGVKTEKEEEEVKASPKNIKKLGKAGEAVEETAEAAAEEVAEAAEVSAEE